ncbi:MAG: replicative DNA helicase [Oscillospiraceae bacterium]|nr:replicative DNA helicase [Oscillospiraceae bacterium]MDD4413635.1 replicative DNA helicase [Oscillospiraceae bacterium]
MATAARLDYKENRSLGDYKDGISLPYSLEAEQAVLGSILLDPNCINDVADKLRVEHFYLPEHQAIYRVMSVKMIESQTIDFVTVLESLKAEGFFSGEEGKSYLLKLAQIVPSISNIGNYTRIVKGKYEVRMLIGAAREIMDDAMDASIEPSVLLDSAEQKIYEIRQGRQVGGLIPIHEVLASNYEIFNKLASDERDQFVGIPTGISALDDITTGLNRSDLIIVGARPGMGKTSFALNIARNVAVKRNKTVAFFTLEMSREQLVNRLLSSEAKVSSKKLRVGNLTSDEWSRIAAASSILCKAPMYFDDTSSITVPEMKARLRRLKKVDFVVVDYLQLMHSAQRTENRVQEVSEITRSLKIMAKELNVPLMVCAQLARGTERTANHRPALSDLRESGSIEQDADQVLFIYRDEYYKNEKDDPSSVETGTSEVIVSKNRHGELGTVKLAWFGEFTQFTSLEMHRSE